MAGAPHNRPLPWLAGAMVLCGDEGHELVSINPSTGETLATHEPLDDARVEATLAKAGRRSASREGVR